MEDLLNKVFEFGTPMGQRLIVKADPEKEETMSGLMIPDSARERPQFGYVLAVGKLVQDDFNAGDRVMFGKHAGIPMLFGEDMFYVMHEREIFLKLAPGELPEDISKLLEKE